MGFDTDPVQQKCCERALSAPDVAGRGRPGGPRIPSLAGMENGTCPTCPECKPPVIDCKTVLRSSFNPAFKDCCDSHDGNLYFMMAAVTNCVKSASDCNKIVNIGGDL
jgi:hypothetical protein